MCGKNSNAACSSTCSGSCQKKSDVTVLGQWKIEKSEDGHSLFINRGFENGQIHVKNQSDVGFSVDLYSTDNMLNPIAVVASASAEFKALAPTNEESRVKEEANPLEQPSNENEESATLPVSVFFEPESHAWSELVATFENEDLYMACLPALQAEALKRGCIITESIS